MTRPLFAIAVHDISAGMTMALEHDERGTLRARKGEMEDARADAEPQRTYLRAGWTCFHCGERFPESAEGIRAARDHFGDDPFHSEPACIMQLDAGDRYWLRQCVQLHQEIGRYQDEDSNLARELAKQSSKHAEQLMRAEEQGYARGIDGGFAHWREAFARLLLDGDATPRPPLGTSPRETFAACMRAMSIEQARAILDPPAATGAPTVIATPHLRKVCELIDADNGGHHIERIAPGSIEPIEARMRAARGEESEISLIMWDMWLGTLSEAQLDCIAAGEQSDREALLAQCLAPGLDAYLNRYFDAPEPVA